MVSTNWSALKNGHNICRLILDHMDYRHMLFIDYLKTEGKGWTFNIWTVWLALTPFIRMKYNSINHTLCQKKMKGFKKDLLVTHIRATPLRTNERWRWVWCKRNNEKCIWQINILKAMSIIPYIYDSNNGCHNNLAIIHNRRTIKSNFISKNKVSKQTKHGEKNVQKSKRRHR